MNLALRLIKETFLKQSLICKTHTCVVCVFLYGAGDLNIYENNILITWCGDGFIEGFSVLRNKKVK